jgi:hypothetical protein
MGVNVSITPQSRFTPGTHWTGGWVGPRAGLDTEDTGKILCLCRGSKPDRHVVQPVVKTPFRLSYPAPAFVHLLLKTRSKETVITLGYCRHVRCCRVAWERPASNLLLRKYESWRCGVGHKPSHRLSTPICTPVFLFLVIFSYSIFSHVPHYRSR